jgi:hydrogenase maturation protease
VKVVHIVGVGTVHGDDAVGLAVARRLAASALPPGIVVRSCERPVPDLLDALDGAAAVVLVDAARTGTARPGTLLRLDPALLARRGRSSCHGLGLADALALARALGRAPHLIEVIGVEVGAAPAGSLSAPLAAVLPVAADSALGLACDLLKKIDDLDARSSGHA